MSEKLNKAADNLLHYGVVGMKWGKRREYRREITAAAHHNRKGQDAEAASLINKAYGNKDASELYGKQSKYHEKELYRHLDKAAKLGMSKQTVARDIAESTILAVATLPIGGIAGVARAQKVSYENEIAKAANARRKLKGYK